MLQIQNLTKEFNGKVAVKDLNIKLEEGEIFALIGPNGSGKTTIIKTIAGLLAPSSGHISVGGMDTVKEPVKTKSLIGYIPDEPSVWSSLTGEEFLQFSGVLYSLSGKERDERIQGLLNIFNLKGIEKGNFEDYSRGNKQKFAILAALLHSPKLLLVDEPIVGLDPTSADIAKKRFKEFALNRGTILVATHTLDFAEDIAHRIGLLKYGRLLAVGTFAELKEEAGLDRESSLVDVYKALT